MLKKQIASVVGGMALMLTATGCVTPTTMEPGQNSTRAVSVATITSSIETLGYTVSSHTEEDGDPHLVITDAPDGVSEMAVFLDDCGKAGCEDITLYANFGKHKNANLKMVNDWNHIGNKYRSTAFISGDYDAPSEEVGLSMTISFLSDEDSHDLSWLMGLFVVEAQLFSALLK